MSVRLESISSTEVSDAHYGLGSGVRAEPDTHTYLRFCEDPYPYSLHMRLPQLPLRTRPTAPHDMNHLIQVHYRILLHFDYV